MIFRKSNDILINTKKKMVPREHSIALRLDRPRMISKRVDTDKRLLPRK